MGMWLFTDIRKQQLHRNTRLQRVPKYCEFLTRHGIHVNDLVDTLTNMLEQLLDK